MDFFNIVDRINEESPYKVMLHNESGACLFFTTDQDLTYIVSFIKDDSFADDLNSNAYHFLFKERDDKRSKYDAKVKLTISIIAMRFIEDTEKIVFFICDAKDNRENARSILFDKWFHELNQNGEYYKHDRRMDYPDCAVLFSFICRSQNPYIQKCVDVINESF